MGHFGFEQLQVYHLAVAYVAQAYKVSEQFPSEDRSGLTSQLRRAATSVPLNIAEGKGRGTDRDFAGFLYQARGSLLESVSALDIAIALGFLEASQIVPLKSDASDLQTKLNALLRTLNQSDEKL